MKVLKENNPTTVGKCNLCGSTLEISISDFNITFFNNVYVKCPICNKKLYITDDQLKHFGLTRKNNINGI